jgi:hypothetical protein
MPTFMDHHPQFPKPEGEQLAQLRQQIEAPADDRGVKGINVFFTHDGGAYCMFDAPDAEAVSVAHSRNGVSVGDIVEITAAV